MTVSILNSADQEFGLNVQLGLVPGVSFNNKFGRNITTATSDAIWAISTPYVVPAAAGVLSFSSTGTANTSTGTGARTVSFTGLDSNYNEVTETITLNGVTPVLSSGSYWNVQRAFVATGGTADGATCNINITSTVAGSTQMGTILFSYNQTQSTIYWVPQGYTGYINLPKVTVQSIETNKLIDIGFFKKTFTGVWRQQVDFLFVSDHGEYFQQKSFGAPLRFEEKSIILAKCITAGTTGAVDVAVDYDIWLVANSA
tara:strand:- start:16 stop:786 length:771 start_codon:yes stop_codon:yes gene_type:complete